MIDFHYWPTPNGWKVSILLEELAVPYRPIMVDISKGEQFTPEFMAISPNHRMPAIVDHDVDGDPVPVFESGAIMLYLAEKHGRFMPVDRLGRKEMMEWVFWQVGNLGPMAGQYSHFVNYAPQEQAYSHRRYKNEYHRCLGGSGPAPGMPRLHPGRGLHDRRHDLVALGARRQGHGTAAGRVSERDPLAGGGQGSAAVRRGVDLGKEFRRSSPPTEEERKVLFNQTAHTAGRAGIGTTAGGAGVTQPRDLGRREHSVPPMTGSGMEWTRLVDRVDEQLAVPVVISVPPSRPCTASRPPDVCWSRAVPPAPSIQPAPKPLMDLAAPGRRSEPERSAGRLRWNSRCASHPLGGARRCPRLAASRRGAGAGHPPTPRWLRTTAAAPSVADAAKVFLRRAGDDDTVRQRPRSALRSSKSTPPFAR